MTTQAAPAIVPNFDDDRTTDRKLAIICSKGSLDMAYPGLILANAARMSGIEATQRICEFCPHTQIMILSMYHTAEHIQRAKQAGAVGYLLKDSAGAELVTAIRSLHSGKSYFSQKTIRS